MTLRIGLYVPSWGVRTGRVRRWSEMRAIARTAEALGVDTLWVADEPSIAWECWTILTALAEATTTVGVGPLVASTRYREPAFLATMVRALDEVSAGRLVLGLGSGAGAGDRRWPKFGWDGARHVSRFAESVEVTARLLRDGPIAFAGEFFHLAEPGLEPPGPRRSGPPIWVAARRPRTMEVAARWGDAVNWNASITSPEAVAELAAAAREACATVGRDPTTLPLTGWTRLAPSADAGLDADRADTIAGTPANIADRLAAIHEAGLAHMTCFVGDEDDPTAYPSLTERSLERFAPILEALRA